MINFLGAESSFIVWHPSAITDVLFDDISIEGEHWDEFRMGVSPSLIVFIPFG